MRHSKKILDQRKTETQNNKLPSPLVHSSMSDVRKLTWLYPSDFAAHNTIPCQYVSSPFLQWPFRTTCPLRTFMDELSCQTLPVLTGYLKPQVKNS